MDSAWAESEGGDSNLGIERSMPPFPVYAVATERAAIASFKSFVGGTSEGYCRLCVAWWFRNCGGKCGVGSCLAEFDLFCGAPANEFPRPEFAKDTLTVNCEPVRCLRGAW